MAEQNDVSGYWAGIFVHFPSFELLALNLEMKGDTISGSYEIPDSPEDPEPSGGLSGAVSGDSIVLRLAWENQHGPLEMQGTVLSQKGQMMISGTVLLPRARVPFGTLTAFRAPQGERVISGVWSALEFDRQ
jgi:hypothetical protein